MGSEQDLRKHQIASQLFKAGRFEDAFHRYLELAESGAVPAQTLVGWLYYKGQGVTQDLERARMWLERAAVSGSPVALFYLGGFYRGQKKYREAIEYLERAAEQEYPPALYHLSIMYRAGEGVPIDEERAQCYLRKAASMGNLKAQNDIAIGLIKGNGGIWRIPQGVISLAWVLVTAMRLSWTDPDSDRIRF